MNAGARAPRRRVGSARTGLFALLAFLLLGSTSLDILHAHGFAETAAASATGCGQGDDSAPLHPTAPTDEGSCPVCEAGLRGELGSAMATAQGLPAVPPPRLLRAAETRPLAWSNANPRRHGPRGPPRVSA